MFDGFPAIQYRDSKPEDVLLGAYVVSTAPNGFKHRLWLTYTGWAAGLAELRESNEAAGMSVEWRQVWVTPAGRRYMLG
jgi:hypothetical protein